MIKFTSLFDQDLCEVGEYPPVTLFGCVGQIVPRNFGTNAHVIHFFGHGVQTGNDVPQTFAICQLGECHDAKVIGTHECLNVAIPVITVDASLKSPPRHAIHDLRKYKFPLVH